MSAATVNAPAPALPAGYYTTGMMARDFGVPPHRITYLVLRLRVDPVGRWGPARVFGQDAYDIIKAELTK